ncbi:MAG: hypothetical protein KatS3mg087_0554 [Patescibacteria group bacterium]|jgi:hypothetical protein|nr:MAG: hypothetical protein KatS3mg087_0554 [Patescibacteria group bacterium]
MPSDRISTIKNKEDKLSQRYEIFNEFERQAWQAAIDLDQDLEDFAALDNPGDRTVVNWIMGKHAAHNQSLHDFNAILDAIQEE